MTFKVRVLRRAQSDVAEIARYLARDSAATADRIVNAILSAMDTLDELPERGGVPRDEHLRQRGYRYLLVGPYLVFYKVLKTEVRIHRVVHGRREYRKLL